MARGRLAFTTRFVDRNSWVTARWTQEQLRVALVVKGRRRVVYLASKADKGNVGSMGVAEGGG